MAPRPRATVDAIGLDDFKPWAVKQKPVQAGVSASGERYPLLGQKPLKRDDALVSGDNGAIENLVRDACVALGRTHADAEYWIQRFTAEWLDDLIRLRGMDCEEWRRLAMPVALEQELRRRLGTMKAVRPGSAPVRRTYEPRKVWRMPGTHRNANAGRKFPRRLAVLDEMCAELRQRRGAHWPFLLLCALHQQDYMDTESLLKSLRAIGLTELTRVQAERLHRNAAPYGGEPSAESLVYALHGPINESRAGLVQAAFDSFDSLREGRIAVKELRRRCVLLEHPAVKMGRWSAEEASRSLFHAWSVLDTLSAEEFMASHLPLSSLAPTDERFAHMLRTMWQIPVKRFGSICGEEAASPILERRRHSDEGVLHSAHLDVERQRLEIEAEVQRSNHTKQLLDRLRTALRRRANTDTIARLARSFEMASERQDNRLQADELERALRRIGVGMSSEDVQDLMHAMDRDGNGYIDVGEWLDFVCGPLPSQRAAVVREAFHHLDTKGDGVVDISGLGRRYASWKHPDVASGRRSSNEVRLELLESLGAAARGGRRINLNDFVRYYETISASVEDDKYFFHLVRSAWGLDHSDPYTQFARNARHAYDGHILVTEAGLSG